MFKNLKATIFGKAQTLPGEYAVYIWQLNARPPKSYGAFIEGSQQRKLWMAGTVQAVAEQVKRDFEQCLQQFQCGYIDHGDWQPGAPPAKLRRVV